MTARFANGYLHLVSESGLPPLGSFIVSLQIAFARATGGARSDR
jgi:hypothetical protein